MKNITITELKGEDVYFDQQIDTDTVVASAGAIAVNGDVDESAFNTGINTGVIAGDDVDLDDSIIGDDNLQANHSEIGALAGKGDATFAQGENVNLGSGQLIDVDAKEDAQVVTGHANEVTGDVDVDLEHVEGPVNLAVGDDNNQQAVRDESATFEDSFNVDKSIDDSFNQAHRTDVDLSFEDNDVTEHVTEDSFNKSVEENTYTSEELEYSYEDSSSYEDNDSWREELHQELQELHVWGDDNDIELDA